MAEILTPCCPLCGDPGSVRGWGQAFCGNDDCVLRNWTPTLSLDSNLLHAGVVKLPPASDERD